jgi:peroxisomal coenzyme A diphosphatase NUDT7
LPNDDSKIPSPYRIEQLCELPHSLARTELVVRPSIALLHADDLPGVSPSPSVEESLIPRLDAKEVAAVFSAPFHNFLKTEDEVNLQQGRGSLPPGKWYEGSWTHWHEEPWRLHYFYVPVNSQHVSKPKVRDGGLASLSEDPQEAADAAERYMVWGMTARILVDAATVAFDEQPEFEHNAHFGDEKIVSVICNSTYFVDMLTHLRSKGSRRWADWARRRGPVPYSTRRS